MMGFCEKCLERNWKYQKVEDIIRATCQVCGHEVEFLSTQARKKIKRESYATQANKETKESI